MFEKVLVANRGEIAVRIMRTCKEMGIRVVAVYSEADRYSLHVRYASEAVPLGGVLLSESYLNMDAILAAAEKASVQAIHPGYGFLAENAEFADRCEKRGFRFIGPPSKVLKVSGDKISARGVAVKAGIPVIPGSGKPVKSVDEAISAAEEYGFPILLKASSGGGGRGMRLVSSREELGQVFESAAREIRAAFGNDIIYVEKFIERPRHIEVQILADGKGSVIHLGERDCTIQRRYQKLIEESPSPVLSSSQREKVTKHAVRVAEEAGYRSCGTVEFLVDRKGSFYFLEFNNRIQVEHPITEMVTGIDLIKAQIEIAADYPLSYKQNDIKVRGHAIECRINAEDPANNFVPTYGTVTRYSAPGGFGVRVDSGIYGGYTISPYYDPLVAKLIVLGYDRREAIVRTLRSLDEFIVRGVKTTIPFHKAILRSKDFWETNTDTFYVQRKIHELRMDERKPDEETIVLAATLAYAFEQGGMFVTAPLKQSKLEGASRWVLAARIEATRRGGLRT